MSILEKLEDDCICSFDKYTSRYVKLVGFQMNQYLLRNLPKPKCNN